MPRGNTVQDIAVEVVVYTKQGDMYTPTVDEDGDETEVKFDVRAEFSPYHRATWTDPEYGGELENLEVADKDGTPVTQEFMTTHYTDTRRYDVTTKTWVETYVTLYDYITSRF